jgi:drug/metabolite transporter (DMT)-like permease
MSATLVATAAGIVTAICWGVGDWLTPRSKAKLSAWQINFVVNLLGAIIFSIILILSSPHLPTGVQTLKIVGASALICIGYIVFVKALIIGAVGIVVPLSSTYPLVTLLLSIIFLNQIYTHMQIAAMAVIVLGAVLLAYEKNHQNLAMRTVYKASFLTLGAVLSWGLGFFVLNPLIPKVQWQVLLSFLDLSGLLIASVLMLVVYKGGTRLAVKQAVTNNTAVKVGLLMAIGTTALYMAAGHIGSIIIPAVLSSLSPLISAGLGAAIDKEQLGVLRRVGALVAVGGIVLLNVA